jgi:hypothetical protein
MELFRLYRFHSEDGNYLAIVVSKGRKWIHYVSLGYPISLHKVRVEEEQYFTDIGYQANPMEKFQAYAGHMGITKGAQSALKGGK